MTARLTLGTANFGLSYGIANNRMLSKNEAFAILEKAVRVGISSVDTARGYGDAEKVLGRFFEQHGKAFEVITKLPDREYQTADDVKAEIETSLENLNTDRIDVLLLHSFRSFQRFKHILQPVFEQYRSAGVVGEYGMSVYHPYEVETALGAGFCVAAAQFPLNLFDQRFLKGGYIEKFRASGIKLYARSIFLQGLFFADRAFSNGRFQRARPKLEQLSKLARMHDTSVERLAILFALSSGTDYLVLGVDSVDQLERNAAHLANDGRELFATLKHEFDMLEISDEEIILPYRWEQ